MNSDSSRASRAAKTGLDGRATFAGLASGEKQAYRVNVPNQGAKYSSTPFRLPPKGGYAVQIRRLPVTRDERMVVLYMGATSVELKDDRIKVVQQAKLLNLGGATYVFPEAGTLMRLPKGFMAVQTQESMTDQHVTKARRGPAREGFAATGRSHDAVGVRPAATRFRNHFTIDVPWLIFAYRVITDAPPGMTLEVDGMPEPIVHSDAGRHFLVTEIQRKVGDEPFRRLHITLRGIPGPGPERWFAAALALFVIAAGVRNALRPKSARREPESASDFEARKRELLEHARELRALHDAGEIGPEYHMQQMTELESELAELLFEQAAHKGPARGVPAPRLILRTGCRRRPRSHRRHRRHLRRHHRDAHRHRHRRDARRRCISSSGGAGARPS